MLPPAASPCLPCDTSRHSKPGPQHPRCLCNPPLPWQVMLWIAGYRATLGEFGVEEGECSFPAGSQAGLSLLIDKYVQRIKATLASWLVNIVEVRRPCGRAGWWGWGNLARKESSKRGLCRPIS